MVFTYGSLMCHDIMSRVCGESVQGEAARLADYARHPLRGETYPGLVAFPGGQVTGRLYHLLDESRVLSRLDAFEGEMYARHRVCVNPVGGGQVEAWCYILEQVYCDLLLPGDWDFATFLASGKADFEARYLGFLALD